MPHLNSTPDKKPSRILLIAAILVPIVLVLLSNIEPILLSETSQKVVKIEEVDLDSWLKSATQTIKAQTNVTDISNTKIDSFMQLKGVSLKDKAEHLQELHKVVFNRVIDVTGLNKADYLQSRTHLISNGWTPVEHYVFYTDEVRQLYDRGFKEVESCRNHECSVIFERANEKLYLDVNMKTMQIVGAMGSP
jgi:hypothetical protein